MSSRPPPILPLSERLISQIAAGEVIERPASVVKELLENALDAGADRIEIAIEQAGRRLIRITDNGHGIARDQLALALQRHATSKIQDFDDLVSVASLGFRGEALASIASVSRLSLASRRRDEASGWTIGEGGRDRWAQPQPVGMPVGTVVEVRDLFFNTPARRKFLRSDRTEFQHIQDLVRRLALSRPGVALSLEHEDRNILRLAAATQPAALTRRLERVLGQGFQSHAAMVEARAGCLALKGWFGAPERARSQSDLQFFTINGRIIRDRHVLHAIRMACEGLLPEGRHPCYLLELEMDPRNVDVNVHPAKAEVRFRDPRQVHDFIVSALRQALRPESGEPASDIRGLGEMSPATAPVSAPPRTGRGSRHRPAQGGAAEDWAVYRAASAPATGASSAATTVQALCVLDCRYLLARQGQELWLIDGCRASRELLSRQLHAARATGQICSRPLLIPETVNLSAQARVVLLEHAASFTRLGMDIGPAGPGGVMLRALPAQLAGVDARGLIMDLAGSAGVGLADADVVQALARYGRLPWDWPQGRGLSQMLAALGDAGLLDGERPGLCRRLDGLALAGLLAAAPCANDESG